MELHIYDWEFRSAEAYYLEDPEPAAIAIDPRVEPVRRRMWELVAHGLFRGVAFWHKELRHKQLAFLGLRGIVFRGAQVPEKADPLAVEVLREVLPEMEPDWILDVVDARRLYADDPRLIAAWCELPLEVVLADRVLEDL